MTTAAFAAWVGLIALIAIILVLAFDDDDPRFP